MKRILQTLFILCICINLKAQTMSDNFDSYTAGVALCTQTTNFHTWSYVAGGADDINVAGTGAFSGSNCLYFTSTSASGGPSDIMWHFGSAHNTGTMNLKFKLKVGNAKKAYFNIQGNITMGNEFHSNYFFNNGQLSIEDNNSSLLSVSYPQNVWFDYEMNVNLNTNEWTVLINGTSVGKFQAKTYGIYGIDFFATDATNQFWIDDVSYTYTNFTMPARNGAIAYLDIVNGLVGQARVPSAKIRNLGSNTITSFDVDINGVSQSITGVNIASGAEYVVPFTNNITLQTGTFTYTGTIKNVNGILTDDFAGDDVKSITLTATTPAKDKLVIGEEATGTWCGWCPRGAVALEKMHHYFDGYFQGIAVHNGDPMVVNDYDSVIGTKIGGYPSALVDRGADIDPSSMEVDFLQRIQIAGKGVIKNGAQYDATTGNLNVSLTTTLSSNITGDYRVACVIVEDSVTGTTSGYNQSNYYSSNAIDLIDVHGVNWKNKGNPIPASQMVYDHVARGIAPDFFGIPNAFGASANAGTSITHTFNFNISAFKKDKIHIVGLLIDPAGRIDNGSSSTIDAAVSNGYVTGINDIAYMPNAISIYPNPVLQKMQLLVQSTTNGSALVEVIDMNGKVVISKNAKFINGSNTLEIDASKLVKGAYTIRTSADKFLSTKVFIKD